MLALFLLCALSAAPSPGCKAGVAYGKQHPCHKPASAPPPAACTSREISAIEAIDLCGLLRNGAEQCTRRTSIAKTIIHKSCTDHFEVLADGDVVGWKRTRLPTSPEK